MSFLRLIKSTAQGVWSLIKLGTFIVFSWIAAHLFALFGVFVAVGYPIAWLIAPKRVLCLACRAGKPGQRCEFCQREISHRHDRTPSSLRSLLLNTATLAILALTSIGLVAVEVAVLNQFGVSTTLTKKTVSVLIPNDKQHKLGEVFPLNLEVTGVQTAINAIQMDLSYDPEFLKVVKIDKTDSFATIFIQEEVNNTIGYLRLSGGLPNPGFTQPAGKFATVYFQTQKPGPTQVEFLPSSIVLANDGRGTNVLKEFASVNYLIMPERASALEEIEVPVVTEEIDASVLGKDTLTNPGTKLDFSDQTRVLGKSISATENKAQTPASFWTTIGQGFVSFMSVVDHFILSVLDSVVSIFTR